MAIILCFVLLFCVPLSCSGWWRPAWPTLAWHRRGSFDSCSLQNMMDLHNHTSVWNVSSHLLIMLFNDLTNVYRLVACVHSAWNCCGSLDSGSIIEHYGLHKHTSVWNVWLRKKPNLTDMKNHKMTMEANMKIKKMKKNTGTLTIRRRCRIRMQISLCE
jgi:hypothetical protein